MNISEKQKIISQINEEFPQFEKKFSDLEKNCDYAELEKLSQNKITKLLNLQKEWHDEGTFAFAIDELTNRLGNRVYNETGNYQKAISLIENRLQQTPDRLHFPAFYETLGHSYSHAKQFDLAIKNSKMAVCYAIELQDKNLLMFLNNTAFYYYQNKDFQKAEEEFLFIEKLDPEFVIDPVIPATGMEIYDALQNKDRFYKFLDLALGTYYQDVAEIEALDFIAKYKNDEEYKTIIKNYQNEQKQLQEWNGEPLTFPQNFDLIWRKYRSAYDDWDDLCDHPQKFALTKFDDSHPRFIVTKYNIECTYSLNQLGDTNTFFWLDDINYNQMDTEEAINSITQLKKDPIVSDYVNKNNLDYEFLKWLPGYLPTWHIKARLKMHLKKGYRYYPFFTETITEYPQHFQKKYSNDFLKKIKKLKTTLSLAEISKDFWPTATSDLNWKAQCKFMLYVGENLDPKNEKDYFYFMVNAFYSPKFLLVLKELCEYNREMLEENDDEIYKQDLDNCIALYQRIWHRLYKAGMVL